MAAGPQPSAVSLLTLGCRLNQAETEETLACLQGHGVRAHDGLDPGAGVVVVNTCTVTADASRSSRKLIRKAASGGARVVVTGCYAVAEPETCAGLPGVVRVVANKDKDDLGDVVADLVGAPAEPGSAHTGVPAPVDAVGCTHAESLAVTQARRAFKVQTGCDEGCTFCIIPATRGELTSRHAGDVVAGVRALVAAGAGEVALTGVHLGKYGIESSGVPCLAPLVRRILDEVPELTWLRLSSIEAGWVTDDLLALMAGEDRVCPHLHLPLQSGDDAVLGAMGRPYGVAGFLRVVRRVRDALGPDAGITTDVLVGFPGESDAGFAATCAAVEAAAFTRLHVFRYSPRPGTPAASWRTQVPEDVKKVRSAALRRLGDDLAGAFHRRFLGRPLLTMVELAGAATPHAPGVPALTGTAGNFVKVRTSGPAGLVGRVVPVTVTVADASGVRGDAEPS